MLVLAACTEPAAFLGDREKVGNLVVLLRLDVANLVKNGPPGLLGESF